MSTPSPSPSPSPASSSSGSGSGSAALTVKDSYKSPGGYQWDLMSDGSTIQITSINYNVPWGENGRGPWASAQAAYNDLGAAGVEPESDAVRKFVANCDTLGQQIDRAIQAAAGMAATIEAVNAWVKVVADVLSVVSLFVPVLNPIASAVSKADVKADDVAQKIAESAVNAFSVDMDLDKVRNDCFTANAIVPSAQSVFDNATKVLMDVGNLIKAATS